ncbi:MAG: class I SAM-dependent methyltransferase [Anaerolineales bacterium]|nr:class I SAM-dependent methyltransferase [Anaerolineales bacterium]
MNEYIEIKPDYGNWVSSKLLYVTSVLGLVFLGLSFWKPGFLFPASFFLLAFGYFLYARHQFSPHGGDLQNRIRNLVLEYLEWDGNRTALDIGCGNGPLVIRLAKKYPHARITGVDYWGEAWDYSQGECERNAGIEGVSEQVLFEKASASKLPYKDESFDAVVSNFVFHEVADTKDKTQLIREALRVLKKGGAFSFQDLFQVKKLYGDMDELLLKLQSWGIESVELVKTNELEFIPKALKLPFMVGEIGILHGKK